MLLVNTQHKTTKMFLEMKNKSKSKDHLYEWRGELDGDLDTGALPVTLIYLKKDLKQMWKKDQI